MVYIYNNIFFAKKDFTIGLRTVKSGEIHLIQMTHVPMLIYELPASSLKCKAQPNVIRRSFQPHDQMLYHRTILEPHAAYPIPAGTNYIVLTVQKTAFGLDIIPESLLPQLIQKGFHMGDFRKMKKFNQTPYKLPPPTPIHVPAEKRPLEEKSLPKKRSKVRITPVMRRVSRRFELPMAPVQIPQPPVQIPDVLEPVQISLVPQSPVMIPDVLEPVKIPDVPQSPVQIPLVPQSPVQIPLVPQSPVQIPLVPQSPVQIPVSQVLEKPVQIPLVQIPDVPEHVQIPVSHVSEPPVQILQIPVSQVPQSPVQIPLMQIPDVPEHAQIPVSQVPQPPMHILHVSEPPVQFLHVSEPVQIPVSQVPKPPMQIPPVRVSREPGQLLPELDILTLWSRQMHSTSSCRSYLDPETQLLHTAPLFLMEISSPFLDGAEREPMETMPRVNSCVKKSVPGHPGPWICLSIVACSSLYIFFVCPDLCQKIYMEPSNPWIRQ
ncbi:uncharacterized protein TNCV_3539651 [Trichonephila clavipes]|nr:uncharacterized protein TNCV_3539651 [Trichonephila clavipes]